MRNLLLLIAAIFLFAACNSSSSGDPAKAAEDYIRAKAAGDRDKLSTLLCKAKEADLDQEAASFAGIKTEVVDLSCKRDDGADTVSCSGSINADYQGEITPFTLGNYQMVQENGAWKWCGDAP